MIILNESKIPNGKGRINMDDDLVAVYDYSGKEVYRGLSDYNPYNDDDWTYDDSHKRYYLTYDGKEYDLLLVL